MEKADYIRKEADAAPFRAADGATVFELFHPNNSAIKNISIAGGFLEAEKVARPHYHEKSEEIYYMLSGAGKVRLGDEIFEIGPGDTIYVPTVKIHSLISTGKNPLRVLAIESPPYSDKDTFFVD
jgi:mannose-6-phosphate isomerase-like protein (cupin superfamily)